MKFTPFHITETEAAKVKELTHDLVSYCQSHDIPLILMTQQGMTEEETECHISLNVPEDHFKVPLIMPIAITVLRGDIEKSVSLIAAASAGQDPRAIVWGEYADNEPIQEDITEDGAACKECGKFNQHPFMAGGYPFCDSACAWTYAAGLLKNMLDE